MSFSQLLRALGRQWPIIVVAVLVAAVAGVFYAKEAKPSYVATAVVSDLQSGSSNLGAAGGAGSVPPTPTSPQVLHAAAMLLHTSDAGAASYATEVSMSFEGNTQLLAVTATTPDYNQSVEVANDFANAVVTQLVNQSSSSLAKLQASQRQIAGHIAMLSSQKLTPIVQAELSSDEQSYATFQAQIVTLELEPPQGSIYQVASAASSTKGSKKKVVLIAGLLGLVAGVGIALLRDRLRPIVRGASDVDRADGPEALVELPFAASVQRGRRLPVFDDPDGVLADRLRELRTSLHRRLGEREATSILFTGVDVDSGTTFVAANLAASWALSGRKTVAVSTDLRGPGLDELFAVDDADRGLSLILDGRRSRDNRVDAIAGLFRTGSNGSAPTDGEHEALGPSLRLDIPGFYLMPAGPSVEADPGDLLASPAMGEVVRQLRGAFDFVVLDAAPMSTSSDAASLAGLVDGVVVVVRAGRTSIGGLSQTIARLEAAGANILGVVVNRTGLPSGASHPRTPQRQQPPTGSSAASSGSRPPTTPSDPTGNGTREGDVKSLVRGVLRFSSIDLESRNPLPSFLKLGIATIVALAGSVAACALLATAAVGAFPALQGYAHFSLSDYGKLTAIGVLIASAAWPLVVRVAAAPRWLFLRSAVAVTVLLWLPDFYLLMKGEPKKAVAVLMAMHVAVAVVTYNALVRIAPSPGRAGTISPVSA